MLIPSPILKTAETSLNHLITFDPVAVEKLGPLAGKTLHIRIQPPTSSLYIQCTLLGLRLTNHYAGTTDACLTGPLSSWLNFVQSTLAQKNHGLEKGLSITGNITFTQNLQSLLQTLDVDWEGWLANWVGDDAAHWTHKLLKPLHHWQQQVKNSLRHNLKDYLHEENDQLVTPNELKGFYTGVIEARDRVEKLEARLSNLKKASKKPVD